MSGDYSRHTFDPKKDFSGVLMQQGRVQLDADWNELMGLLDRRVRAETTDIIGECTVPMETPDGFKIEIAGGALTIGRGRMYVDGLLAENHGKAPLEFDPVLAEQRGTLAVPYDEQPYLPNAAAVAPAPAQGGPHLAFLDVWQREVTYLENSDLIEKAVGVDTTTRLQTVWQVRVLANVGAIACDTPDDQIPGWPDIIRPSAGRLSTAAVGVATDPNPCIIPPSGGYRGLENRFYRVEIHDGGAAGTATFKWSRDNASIATSVTAIAALDKLTVARVGRDATLRFNVGDWIEIIDDWLEFAQQPGLIRQIKDVDDATQIITLTSALPAGTFPTDGQGKTDPARHSRIQRWDQQGEVRDTNNNLLVDLNASGSKGVIPAPVAGTSIVLEDGVQITFDTPAAGAYRVGDYWNFAARTADASVETLQQAPPRGIHHHYCRLALVTFPNPPTDCRNLWPPDVGGAGCDCSVCVTADSHNSGALTIQHAIDQVKTVGGTVCLGPGTYDLGKSPITIIGAQSLRVRGYGVKTVLQFAGAGAAVLVEASFVVTLEDLLLVTAINGADPSPAIAVDNCVSVTLQRNFVLRLGSAELGAPGIGLSGILIGTLIRENVVFAPVGIGNLVLATALPANLDVKATQPVPLATAELIIQDNTLACSRRGISLDGLSVHVFQTRLAGNVISNCPQGGILTRGWVMAGSNLDVRGNHIRAAGAGIVVGTDDARIVGNDISPTRAGQGGDGIVLAIGLDRTGMDRCQVLANRITGVAGSGINITGIVRSAMIKQNFIQAIGGGGIVMADTGRAGQLTIENNQLLNLAPQSNDSKTAVVGVRVVSAIRTDIVGNAIIGVGLAAAQSPSRAGIQVINFGSARIAGNEVVNIGPATDFLQDTVGIDCLGTFARVEVTDNSIRRNLAAPASAGSSSWIAVRIGTVASGTTNVIGATMWFVGMTDGIYGFIGNHVIVLPRGKELVDVHGNLLETYGVASAVRVAAGGTLNFSNNRCLLSALAGATAGQPVARAQVGAALASSNYLEGPAGAPAFALHLPDNAPVTVLGNITSGVILINGTALPAPWAPLNVVAS